MPQLAWGIMTLDGGKRATLQGGPDVLRGQVKSPQPQSVDAEQVEELSCFFAHSLDLLCICGLDGYFKRLNPAWTSGLGWSLDQLIARPFIDFVHPDDREPTLAEFAKVSAGANAICYENRYRRSDGQYRWLRWNARLVPGRKRICASARDVTRRKRLEREVLEILDIEKQRLGQELHDGLCQTLAGVAALSSALSRRLASGPEGATAAEITSLLNGAIVDARDLARGLDPVCISEGGLDAALESLAENVRHLFSVACTLECTRPFPGTRPGAAAHLFRIAQEAVHNAVAHGRAKRIEIRLALETGQGVLSVRDDGVGLPEDVSDRYGIGLHTMAYRSRLIGAHLDVRPRSRQGTAVICIFPWPTENPEHAHDSS